MENTITITLNTLHCNREGQGSGGSAPYLWPAMLWVNKDSATVGVLGILDTDSHTILKRGMKPGDTVDIPTKVGMILRPFDDDLTNHVIIVTVALWQDNETPGYAVQAGYRAFQTSLQDAVQHNLLQLNSSDPDTVNQAESDIKTAVTEGVTKGIGDSLSTGDKIKVATGIITLDSPIDSSSTSFSNLVNTAFTISFGGPLGGRLLFYRDYTRNGTGDVDTPSVIGLGGWAGFKFLFSGGDGIIYAVDPQGQLLFYRDNTQNGTGDVDTPSVIGLGGWAGFKFLFSGGDGIIYAVNQQGQLLFYRDYTRNGTGDVDTPQVIGQGGWAGFKFLFSGGNGIIYAVNQQGQLLFYRDYTRDGTGDVNTPQVIGQGGWAGFKFLFSGGDGIIYAVDQQGQLLFYRDYTQNGTGDVDTPQVIGLGGWAGFKFLFSGDNGIIYAVEPVLSPKDSYEIAGNLQIEAVVCVDERAAVSSATADVQSAKQIVASLEEEFLNAPASQKAFLRQQIREAQQDEAAAEQRLSAAKQALNSCLARNPPPRRKPHPVAVG
ncbi:hypothetical protein JAO29_12765 [Edaphobacter sp. HDX4]|uniref:tachylectin-related carbohydrate-binding protein n=1 Tax=Edaphobacter sp. HDX4 TaxID=2794064 RepID=UPI002FE572BD